jgi:hypothetical protein
MFTNKLLLGHNFKESVFKIAPQQPFYKKKTDCGLGSTCVSSYGKGNQCHKQTFIIGPK